MIAKQASIKANKKILQFPKHESIFFLIVRTGETIFWVDKKKLCQQTQNKILP